MPRNHSFDGLRGAAALLVVAYHLEKIGANPAPGGYLAVDFFFVLSGYVIAAAYEDRLRSGLTFGKFAEVRLVRLYPLAFLGTVIGLFKVVAASLGHRPYSYSLSDIAIAAPFNFLMIPAPIPALETFVLNPPVWSLFFELLANALFAKLLFKAVNRVLASFVTLCAIGFIWSALANGDANIGWNWDTFVGGAFRVGYGFSIGHLIFRLRYRLPANRVSWWSLAPYIILTAVLVVPLTEEWRILAAIFVAPAMVIMALIFELPSRLHKLSAFLGDLSYPVYAIHLPIVFAMGVMLHKFDIPKLAYAIIVIPVIALLSYIVGKYFDLPVRGWLSTQFRVRFSARGQAQ